MPVYALAFPGVLWSSAALASIDTRGGRRAEAPTLRASALIRRRAREVDPNPIGTPGSKWTKMSGRGDECYKGRPTLASSCLTAVEELLQRQQR
jgi:hypothetical protein